ncbi:MAG: hypothetical protein KatS3mg028_0342 [Bacteroidia bacterium]|nr:MAG: hypothetical protein KatS3mg028_0342 [Bacteroidia bacterium]
MNDFSNSKQFHCIHRFCYCFFQRCRFPGSRKASRSIAKLLLPKLTQTSVVPSFYGFRIVLPPEKNFEIEEIYYLGFYEAGTMKVIKQLLKNGGVFVDIGASVGLMSLYAAELLKNKKGEVWAFEPVPVMYDALSKSIEINQFNTIRAFNVALGDKEGVLPIYTKRACPSLVHKDGETPDFSVPVQVLDTLVQKNNLKNVRLMKIDVEGFEMNVLKGCSHLLSLPEAPALCIEYESNYANMEVFRFISNINEYRFFQLSKGKSIESHLVEIKDIGLLKPNDNVFCLLPGHIKYIE